MRYSFNGFEFDAESQELRHNGSLIGATPQVLSLLKFFLINRARLVSKQELIDEVWDGRAISEGAISVRIWSLRQTIDDPGGRDALLKTIRGRGFRFTGDVEVQSSIAMAPDSAPPNPNLPTADLLAQPSIAALKGRLNGARTPFDFLAEALPDEILTALARMRSLFVIARGSSFQHRSYDTTPREVGQALKADYLLSSELEINGPRLRISIELAHAKTQRLVWRYSVQIMIKEIHEMREEIVRNVATNIDQSIALNELQSARLRTPDDLAVWQNLHLGISRFETLGAPDFDGATEYFQRAVDTDPGFARAYAGLSMANLSRFFWKWNSGMGLHSRNGLAAAARAYELDQLDPVCALAAARRHFFIGQHEIGESYLKKSVELSPSNYWAQADLARLEVQKGNAAIARKHLEIADTIHPAWLNPIYNLETRSLVAIVEHDAEAAVESVRKLEALNLARVYSTMAALTAYHMAGMDEDAARIAAIIRERFDGISGYKVISSNSSISPDLGRLIEAAYAAHGLD